MHSLGQIRTQTPVQDCWPPESANYHSTCRNVMKVQMVRLNESQIYYRQYYISKWYRSLYEHVETIQLIKNLLVFKKPNLHRPDKKSPQFTLSNVHKISLQVVGFEILTAMLRRAVFWVITPYSPMKVNWHFGGTCRLLPFNELRGVIFQKIEIFKFINSLHLLFGNWSTFSGTECFILLHIRKSLASILDP
jgi:hypothetical protein